MAFRAGTTTFLLIGNAAGAQQNLSAYANTLTLPNTVAQLETTVFGLGDKTFIPGIKGGDKMTLGGPMDATFWTQMDGLRTSGSLTPFTIGWAGSVATYPKAAGSLYFESWTPNSTVAGLVVFTASLQVTGAITNSVW